MVALTLRLALRVVAAAVVEGDEGILSKSHFKPEGIGKSLTSPLESL